MSHRLRAIGVLGCLLLALQTGTAAAAAKPGTRAQTSAATAKENPPPSTTAESAAIDVAAGLYVARQLVKQSSKGTRSRVELRSATLARIVGALEFSARQCDAAVGTGEQAEIAWVTNVAALCRAVKDELAAAQQ